MSQAEESSDSSSSSDSSDSDFDDEVQWFKQSRNGKAHLVQDVLASSLVPWCRASTFPTPYVERGDGADASMVWCSTCLQRCPIRVSRNLREILQDSAKV